MNNEITSIRLLAIAYAKGHISRSEYIQARGKQISALEFSSPQPKLENGDQLMQLMAENVSFLKESKVLYFDGKVDPTMLAKLRSSYADSSIGDSESKEYRGANRLAIIAGIIIFLAVVLQFIAHFTQKRQVENQNAYFEKMLETKTTYLSKELRRLSDEADRGRTAEEYDELATQNQLGKDLFGLHLEDLNKTSLQKLIQITEGLDKSSTKDRKVVALTTWFASLVEKVENYSANLDKALAPTDSNSTLSQLSNKEVAALKRRRNVSLNLFSSLATMQLEYDE